MLNCDAKQTITLRAYIWGNYTPQCELAALINPRTSALGNM